MKEYGSIVAKLEAEISNHGHPYMIDFPIDMGIILSHCLGGGSFGTALNCKILGVMAKAGCHCFGAHEQVIHGLCYL